MQYLIISQHKVFGQTKRFFADLDRALTIYHDKRLSDWNTSTEMFCRMDDEMPWLRMQDTEGA